MELTKKDRIILANQFEILKILDEGLREKYEDLIEILRRGYQLFYSQIEELIDSDELPAAECALVLDVLSIYRMVEDYKTANPQDAGIADHYWGRFVGFDGNNEAAYLSFAEFLFKQNKFEELGPHVPNSHMPTLQKYRKMVAIWKRNRGDHALTKDIILEILEA